MGQVTIYLNEALTRKMRSAAEEAGISQSRWIADLIEERLETDWPESFRRLAGAMPDFPLAEQIHVDQAADLQREDL